MNVIEEVIDDIYIAAEEDDCFAQAANRHTEL